MWILWHTLAYFLNINIILGNLLETFEIFPKKVVLRQKLPISLLLSALDELDA
jgi:hypothetical protein